MTDALIIAAIAGAAAGAIAGLIAGGAVLLATRRPTRGDRARAWQFRSAQVIGVERPSPLSGPPVSGRVDHVRPKPFSAIDRSRFDESATRVLGAAADEAIRFNHNYIGTEHLLAGIVRADTDGVAGRVLIRLGVELSKVRTALEFIIGRGDSSVAPGELTLSPRTQKILVLADQSATARGSGSVGAADLLLGLIREGQGIASGVLESLGLSLEHLHDAVLAELSGSPPPPRPEPRRPETARGYRGPFDRFNDRAKRVLALAQDEAIQFGHNYMGAEHLLLALIREGEGVAARVHGTLGVDATETRRGVETLIGRVDSPSKPSSITLSPGLKKIFQLAIDEARQLGSEQIATEHLLLGLLRDGGNNACVILTSKGLELETIRLRVIATIKSQEPPSASPS